MVQQLTIFDAAPKKEAFAVGDTVEVVVNVSEKHVEDYYYLKVFEGMPVKWIWLEWELICFREMWNEGVGIAEMAKG